MSLIQTRLGADGLATVNGELVRDSIEQLNGFVTEVRQSSAVTLDLQGVEKADMAGLAWIIDLISQANQAKTNLTIRNLPITLTKLAKISGVESVLPLE